jgi:pimeloyl-ACP methyl ester carboxylesterase
VATILDLLRAGTLAPDVPACEPRVVVGAGQSLGGHVLAGMQAFHRTFDGVAMLGSSMVGTYLPPRPDAAPFAVPDGASPLEAAMAGLAQADWPWIFHWDPEPDSAGAALVAADLAGGVPARRIAPPWGSTTYPGFSAEMMLPGAMAEPVARIDVPVLLARGERDVCYPPAEEVASFTAATDVSLYSVPRMAHMHNFAATRAVLWRRLDEFVAHVARGKVLAAVS